MANDDSQLKLRQFVVGVVVTILSSVLATYCSYRGTAEQIELQRDQTRRLHASTLLKEISGAVSEVRDHLLSYASMALEIEMCFSGQTSRDRCLKRPFDFDAIAIQKAWNNLDSSIKGARPFILGQEESDLLSRLEHLKDDHQVAVRPLLPPDSFEKAAATRAATEQTIRNLINAERALGDAIARRSQNL